MTVTNNGTITNSGTIEEYGQISGNDVSNSGGTVSVPATVSVSTSSATVTYGGSVTLTANVTNATDGSVDFYLGEVNDGNKLNDSTVTVSKGTATLNNVQITSTNGFTTGSHPLTAVYSG